MGEIWGKIKLKGMKKADEFSALFDSGSTLSHLDKTIAEELGVVMLEFGVTSEIGDGSTKQDKLGVAFANIDGCQWPIFVSVSEKGAVPVTIGHHAMQTMGIKLDPQNETYTVRCNVPKL